MTKPKINMRFEKNLKNIGFKILKFLYSAAAKLFSKSLLIQK